MRRRSDQPENWDELRDRIIGLGEQSSRKSYYPELRARVRELEETKKSLAELNAFQQAVIDAATEVAVIATSPEGIITLFNRGAEKLLGYRAEEVLGLTTPLSFHLAAEITRHAEELSVAYGKPISGFQALTERPSREGSEKREWTHIRKDGRQVAVELVVTAIREDGQITGYLGMAEDISERKQAVEQIRLSEQKYASIFQLSPDMIGITRMADGTFIEVNAGFEEWTGWTRNEVIGRSSLDIGLWKPEVRSRAVEAIKKQGRLGNYEFVLSTKSGEKRNAVMYLTPISIMGEEFLYFMARDITENKRAEQTLSYERARLHTLLQTIPDLVWLKDPDGVYLACNARFEQLYGAKEKDILGKTDYDFVGAELANFFREHDKKAITAGMPSVNEEWLTFADDGHRELVETIKTPMRDTGGNLIGVLGIARNITELKQAEEEIRKLNETLEQRVRERTVQLEVANKALSKEIEQRQQAQEEIESLNMDLKRKSEALELANRELESFSYSVSHDLKAPLRNLTGLSNILLEDFADSMPADSAIYLHKIDKASRKMAALVDAILKLSKISIVEINPQPVDLSSLARELVNELKEDAPDRNVQVEIADGLTAMADPTLMRVLLQNLLGNAWKYSRDSSPANISFFAEENEGNTCFCIRDNGTGFDMAYADKLFGAFQRLHGAEYEGTGIGLATVQRIIHRHGGQIRAVAEPGKGAAFCFTLGQH